MEQGICAADADLVDGALLEALRDTTAREVVGQAVRRPATIPGGTRVKVAYDGSLSGLAVEHGGKLFDECKYEDFKVVEQPPESETKVLPGIPF